MRMTSAAMGMVGVIGLLGCGMTPEPEGRDVAGRARDTQTASGLAEYRHTPDRSRMLTGPNTVSRVEDGQQKLVGDWGVLAVSLANGHSQGVPNADAVMLTTGPFGATLAEHNDHARAMFVDAGVPAAEIGQVLGSVGGDYRMQAGGAPEPAGNSWYTSTLTRVAGDIAIADSFAWARIDANDDVVSEAVYWPAISQTVIDQANAFKSQLDTPAGWGSFAGRLPMVDKPEVGSGRVVIHHSSAVVDGPFEAYAVWDITTRVGGSSFEEHFDANGIPVRLPQERRMTPVTSKGR